MPAVNKGTILVTGASGFIGTHVVRVLLEHDLNVRAVARTTEKTEHIRNMFPAAGDRLSFALVPDMSADGAYHEAVKGVDGVVHLASPVTFSYVGEPSGIIGPAVAGVTAILDSIAKFGPTVKRIVQVSSIAATSLGLSPVTITEADWNDDAVNICEAKGAKTDSFVQYSASKAHAERAFWQFFENPHTFDGATILPGLTLGPYTQYTADGRVGGTASLVVPYLKKGVPESSLSETFFNLVDVRDVADACVAALETPAAGGERFIVAGDKLVNNDYALAAEGFPKAVANGATKGNHDAKFQSDIEATVPNFDGSKAQKVLGIKYRSKAETIHDTIASVIDRI